MWANRVVEDMEKVWGCENGEKGGVLMKKGKIFECGFENFGDGMGDEGWFLKGVKILIDNLPECEGFFPVVIDDFKIDIWF